MTLLCVLILKIDKPEMIKQFRPISLCNTSYKILAKVLVKSIRPFMHHFISHFQASFIPGRRADDNVVILREAILSLANKRGNSRLIMLNLE